jgi:hypothetical protein
MLAFCGDRRKVKAMRDRVPAGFASLFSSRGFRNHPMDGLIPSTDKSVRFTGSTISTLKPYLLNRNIPDEGIFIVQRCLRTQNASTLEADSVKPVWASYFLGMGVLARYSRLDELADLAWVLFTRYLDVSPDRVRIRISSKDDDLNRYWSNKGLERHLEYNTKDPVYYTHKFGIDHITGRNCNVAIVDPDGRQVRDVGNIIVIEDSGTPVGVELAFGVETIVSRLLGLSSPIEAGLIADIVSIRNEYSLKLADAISACIAILDAGERPIATTNRGRILRTYLQALSYLRVRANVSIEEMARYAAEFEEQQFGKKSSLAQNVAAYLKSYEDLKNGGLGQSKINEAISSIFPPRHSPRQA